MPERSKLLLFTDTYAHQVNGAKVTLEELTHNCPENIEIVIVSTDDFSSIPFPTYAEIRFAMVTPRKISSIIKKEKPDMIHIVTEGTIGFAAARACRKLKIPYTTAFHTKFPEYIALRIPFIQEKIVHKALHYIHGGASHILVSSPVMQVYLEDNSYPKDKIAVIPFGVDHTIFSPGERTLFHNLPKPILLFVGRVSIEKNIGDFIAIETEGTKIVVGDGPLRESLKEQFSEVQFLGYKSKTELRDIYCSSDVFVFPSLTDTLGLVNIEALSCGLPVLGYDIGGLSSIITNGLDGVLIPYGKSLTSGLSQVLKIPREQCIETSKKYNWKDYTRFFLSLQIFIPRDTWI
ncbi:glycosyltransferase family 1 protein [Candidatus Gracilibacteria bacterium]|nr:glycosyltransferase family 1 protein [Candidatus Gracilibacteria bacterium]